MHIFFRLSIFEYLIINLVVRLNEIINVGKIDIIDEERVSI